MQRSTNGLHVSSISEKKLKESIQGARRGRDGPLGKHLTINAMV